uniref:Zinc finger, FYVE domain containing 1 n=1 Tax=Oryzias latipes TaxID=8090 RepID=A0A3P9KYE5_ORYLA
MVGSFLMSTMSEPGSEMEQARPTVLVCQESFACGGSDEATYECDECGSLQCIRCELELHRQKRMRNHDRVQIKAGHVPFCDLCKGGRADATRVRAAVRCQGCKINLCLDCQKRTHAGVNKRKHPLTLYPPAKESCVVDGEMEVEALRSKLEEASSFLLVNEKEEVQVKDEEDFVCRLGCKPDELLKVVSIFGNTGEGKSHTLNHTFFLGREVFKTLPTQESCTVGVWAALDPLHRVVVIDTEGLLGAGANQGQRLLLKVLAISDVIIYRTHSDRLHDDLFRFLGDASDAYLKHFTKELKATSSRCGLDVPLSTLGPAVIVFHETVHTKLLGSDRQLESAECLLQERFQKLGLFPKAFSSLQYCGTRTYNPPTDFSGLLRRLERQLDNNSTRSPRSAGVIYRALQALSERFSGEIPDEHSSTTSFFPEEYFTCCSVCLTCGYVLECPNCGVIYRSRQYWYGNQDPVETVVRTEIQHVWPGSDSFLKDNNNAAQRLLDGVKFISQSVSELSVTPAKAVTSWLTDQIAPPYWKPNSLILKCHKCSQEFQPNTTKHHCRACGEGFCDACSSKSRPVPERGWGPAPVRVCDLSFVFVAEVQDAVSEEERSSLIARKVGEAVQNTLGAVIGVIDIPLGLVKDAARPAYWVPDQDIRCCCECQREFLPRLTIHHCRACGQGVCDDCSQQRQLVPSRGWDHPVRVCNSCSQKPGDL